MENDLVKNIGIPLLSNFNWLKKSFKYYNKSDHTIYNLSSCLQFLYNIFYVRLIFCETFKKKKFIF